MVDKSLVQRKLTLLDEKGKEVKSYDITSFEDFKAKGFMQKAVEKMLQEMIEICIDVAKHIIADQGFRLPDDMKDSFAVLQEKNVLTRALADKMAKMTGFRNLIVHLYEKIDIAIVYNHYKKNLGDFDLFAKEVLEYLKSGSDAPPVK